MIERLEIIIGKEGVHIVPRGVVMIADAHNGDLRNAINALQVYASIKTTREAENYLHSLNAKNTFAMDEWDEGVNDINDFQYAVHLIQNHSDSRKAIQCILTKNMEMTEAFFKGKYNLPLGHSSINFKLKVIKAAIIAERDFLMGVDENITVLNFVRQYLSIPSPLLV